MLGASLMLSACGAQQPGAAAVVDGHTIRDQDVQRVALELKPLAQDQKALNPGKVLGALIIAPYLLAEAKRTGHDITEAQARKVLAKVAKPSPQTVDFVRSQLAIEFLDQAAGPNILAKLSKSKVTVNPRYGTFDPKQAAINPTRPNWIKPIASPATP
jgi:hypothetical protein